VTIVLKTLAWHLTGSVGFFSDALESLVNLAGALMALWMLYVAALPADLEHRFGHTKAEYFSSAFEGILILITALAIATSAILRLVTPQALEETVEAGLIVSALAALINFFTARTLLAAGRQHHSIALEADARHLITDVWTSVGVITGVCIVALTGWLRLDPLLALLIALRIGKTGFDLVRASASSLMDAALPPETQEKIETVLEAHRRTGIVFHALYTRVAGRKGFMSVHVLVPGNWTIQQGHDKVEEIETALRAAIPTLHVLTHLEPLEDPRARDD
jgi:cation diffusion facilitator family transporter